MGRKVEAARHRLAKYSATVTNSQLREKRIAAATASMLTVTNNFDHYLKTMMIAVPTTAILLHAVTVKEQTVKLFDITFSVQSAALAITALGCVFLLYCARCLLRCVYAIEQSTSKNELRNYLQNHPGVMNPFCRRIELKYPGGVQQDWLDLSIFLHRLVSPNKTSEEIRVELQKPLSDGTTYPNLSNIVRCIGQFHNFVSTNMGLILTVFVWTFLVGSANKIVHPNFYGYVAPVDSLMQIIHAPLFAVIVFIFVFCFGVYLITLFGSLKVVCPTDYGT